MKVSKELRVGVFMVIAITVLYLGFNYLKGIDFFSTNDKYYAIYENVDGLNTSNPVYINGFIVGRVSDIKLLQKRDTGNILVEIDINGEIVLGDSAVVTLTGDFLGNKSILLTPGDISKPKQPGDTLLSRLDRGIADILAESAQPVANSLESTIKKVNVILDNLAGNSDKINKLMDNLQETPVLLNATIRQTQGNLNQIISTYDALGQELQTTAKSVRPLLNNINQLTDSLKQLEVQRTLNEVNASLQNLNKAVDYFTQNEGTLGKLVNDDSLYVNLNRAVLNLDTLLNHFDSAPKDFLSPLGRNRKKIERKRNKN